LRQAGHKGVQLPANNLQAGAKPEHGGSTQRRPNDKAIQRHMDAKNSPARQPGGARISHGPRKAQKLGDAAGHRIARGSPGTSGREIHHKTEIERAGHVPAPHHIGALRTKFSKGKTPVKMGSSGMSPEVGGSPGVPGHQSVINRGVKPSGGYSHAHKQKIASKLSW
jgi:hypothetical protein